MPAGYRVLRCANRVAWVAELIDRGRMGERISGTAKAGGEGVRRLPARHAGLYYKPRQCRGVFMRRRSL
jgi:hypothetical protein